MATVCAVGIDADRCRAALVWTDCCNSMDRHRLFRDVVLWSAEGEFLSVGGGVEKRLEEAGGGELQPILVAVRHQEITERNVVFYTAMSWLSFMTAVLAGTIANSPIVSAGAFIGAGLFGIALAISEKK